MANLFSDGLPFSREDSIVVIGLGRFGGSVAQSLVQLKHDVLGIDVNAESVQQYVDVLTHCAQADTTKASALKQLGVHEFAHAIVAIGSDLSASLLTLMALVELGMKDIWVKAMTQEHAKIARSIGAHHVIFPEADMGKRVAHLIAGRVKDFIEFDDGLAIAKIAAPASVCGQNLKDLAVRERFGVTIIGVKRANQEFFYATPETEVFVGDMLIVSGETKKIAAFSR